MLRDGELNSLAVTEERVTRFPGKTDRPLTSARIPLYSVDAIAGVVEVYEQISDNEPIAYLEIPNLPKCDGAIYVVGDSMYPLLKSGDIIIYKVLHDINNILWGEMYLLSIVNNGDAYVTVKYVKKSDIPGYVTLVSYNEHHQPKDFPIESIRFAAHVKASVRINSMG
ncbi:S24 family peptidase [Tenuifilum osseticum]|uniref:S24 family peptidase n=1 Tax=Tenuifilum osseticum TaxID=3374723 RepID=UPI0034E5851B